MHKFFVLLTFVFWTWVAVPAIASGNQISVSPDSGHWNYPGSFTVTNKGNEGVTVKWFLDCWDHSVCSDSSGEKTLRPGQSFSKGLGNICAKWQLDLKWKKSNGQFDWGGVAEKENCDSKPKPIFQDVEQCQPNGDLHKWREKSTDGGTTWNIIDDSLIIIGGECKSDDNGNPPTQTKRTTVTFVAPICEAIPLDDVYADHDWWYRWIQGDGQPESEFHYGGVTPNEQVGVSVMFPNNFSGFYYIYLKSVNDRVNGQQLAPFNTVPPTFKLDVTNCLLSQETTTTSGGNSANTCTEPSVYLFTKPGKNTQVGVLTAGNLNIASWATTDDSTNVDVSMSPNRQQATWARQDGLKWQILKANISDLSNPTVIDWGLYGNPAINDQGDVLYQDFSDGFSSIKVQASGFTRRLGHAEQGFWFNDQIVGFVRNGNLFTYDVWTRTIEKVETFGNVSQPQVVNEQLVYTADNTGVVVRNLETNQFEAAITLSSQGALNETGELLAYVSNGNLYVRKNGETPAFTLLVDLESDLVNPVWYCSRTLFFESKGVIYAVNYFEGATTITKTSQLQRMTPQSQVSFSAHTGQRPELQRSEWGQHQIQATINSFVGFGQQVVAVFAPSGATVVAMNR